MDEFVRSMLFYLKNGEKSSLLETAEEKIGSDMLRGVLLNIVNWLKLEYKRVHIWDRRSMYSKPLSLNENYPWCKNLVILVQEDKLFGKYFVIEKNGLYYSFLVDEETRNIARKIAFEGYNPPRMS
ncbi:MULTISPECIES: hypothetical protein [Brevibacillus]|uniref:Uncharacterized protein n=1 Tax=Brevibacillus borstelensis AK1 TaxID=1300222 RepID=M8DAM2_9BACL|nr:hypothetical protein [Brevibacillus borstelensis]EMT50428.1 hypothetical protein I532_22095 [Brevibacillus borstelensis AK1]KKX53376.1 hypothetical protein X546_19665 [Brevibacillus borstelensis cifa_chp40]MBE5396586.1 hypothetical protein [Brevibacillus borstelensis]MCM3473327.1 hypothetical protein [Brevibacillus borstelensis]MCM3591543.1 hypothetical protein [Brevibacillus borstelensis]